jgi:two-component SAPR family response regulator
VQLASLELSVSPQRARRSLQELLDEQGIAIDALERTRALYLLAKANLLEGEIQASREAVSTLLSWCGTKGTEQVVAAELAADEEMREFAHRHVGDSPILSVLLHRIDTMAAVSERYHEVAEAVEVEARLELFGLGQSSIRWGGRSITSIKPLAKEVLFFLADHQRVERDVLVETFWPEHPPGRQIANVHMTVYSLRRVLGKEIVVLEGAVYGLNPELPVEYDVARFERASVVAERLPAGDPRRLFALTEAINSYRGTFMPDVSSGWVEERRRALEVRYLDLLTANADEALVRDQPLRAVNTLRQALEIDPLRDDVNQRYLEALGRLGRRSEIVNHYQEYVRLLSTELGLDPPESVRALYARLIS